MDDTSIAYSLFPVVLESFMDMHTETNTSVNAYVPMYNFKDNNYVSEYRYTICKSIYVRNIKVGTKYDAKYVVHLDSGGLLILYKDYLLFTNRKNTAYIHDDIPYITEKLYNTKHVDSKILTCLKVGIPRVETLSIKHIPHIIKNKYVSMTIKTGIIVTYLYYRNNIYVCRDMCLRKITSNEETETEIHYAVGEENMRIFQTTNNHVLPISKSVYYSTDIDDCWVGNIERIFECRNVKYKKTGFYNTIPCVPYKSESREIFIDDYDNYRFKNSSTSYSSKILSLLNSNDETFMQIDYAYNYVGKIDMVYDWEVDENTVTQDYILTVDSEKIPSDYSLVSHDVVIINKPNKPFTMYQKVKDIPDTIFSLYKYEPPSVQSDMMISSIWNFPRWKSKKDLFVNKFLARMLPKHVFNDVIPILEELVDLKETDSYIGKTLHDIVELGQSESTFRQDSRSQDIIYYFGDILKDAQLLSYLDVGCAEGGITHAVGKMLGIPKISGCDVLSSEYCKKMGISHNIEYFQQEEEYCLNFTQSNSQSLVTCFVSLHHMDNPKLMLKEIYRILEPNGYLIIREHDVDDMDLAVMIDILHFFYAIVFRQEMETFKTYYAWYRTKEEWTQIISEEKFNHLRTTENRGMWNIYYSIFQKAF